jgi:hypothetical protein
MPRWNPTSSMTPSATSPASSIALGPDAAISRDTGRPDAYARRPDVPSKSTASPARSFRTVVIVVRISARVAGLRPIVLAEV